MARAELKHLGGVMDFTWVEDEIKICVSNLHYSRDRDPIGTVVITTNANGKSLLLNQGKLNFLSDKAQEEKIRAMSLAYPEVEWRGIITELCYKVHETSRQGEPVLSLSNTDDVVPPEYLIHPFLVKDKPTAIFGLGGTGKSLFGLVLGVLVQMGCHDNHLGLTLPKGHYANVLCLDYETDENEQRWRLHCIINGMPRPNGKDAENIWIDYRRCSLPLAADVEAVQSMLLAKNYGLIIIDSIGAAAGGDLNTTEIATSFMTAVRQLKTTTLLIAHTQKNSMGNEPSIYGNVFFTNYTRSIWHMKKVQDVGDDTINVGLFHRKANSSRLFKPLGYQITFGDDVVTIKKQDIKNVGEFTKDRSIADRVTEWLTIYKHGEIKDIAPDIKAEPESVKTILNRMKTAGKTAHLETGWVLLSTRTEEG